MKLIIAENYDEGSRKIADLFEAVIAEKKDAFLGLATGSTPEGMYECLVEDFNAGKLDFSEVHTINLDEYLGPDRSHPQSFGYFMDKHLFSKVNIKQENIMLVDGAGKAEDEIKKYDSRLGEEPIDILILGIGENGHIGFNEPADFFVAGTHITELAEETIQANSRFFENIEDVPQKAVTMGMAGITNAKKIVLAAFGKKKARAIKKLLSDDKVSPQLPCSILKLCRDVTIVVDKELYRCIENE